MNEEIANNRKNIVNNLGKENMQVDILVTEGKCRREGENSKAEILVSVIRSKDSVILSNPLSDGSMNWASQQP